MTDLIHVSIVTFENNETVLGQTIDCVLASSVTRLSIVDNSPSTKIQTFIEKLKNDRITFLRPGGNLGYGKGHNVALRISLEESCRYHLVLNPDIFFQKGTLEALKNFMDSNPDTGLVMPRILSPSGELQYLCKQLPRPFDLIARRFLPEWLKKNFKNRSDHYEMRNADYNNIIEAPCLSGCFMFLRCSVLPRSGCFDERYFMYLEDLDLSRRISADSRAVYFPGASANHYHDKGSYKSLKLLSYHIKSAVQYFNKWGWWPFY